jgi:hypothetical protein
MTALTMFGLTLGLGIGAMLVLPSVPSSHKESGTISPRRWGTIGRMDAMPLNRW